MIAQGDLTGKAGEVGVLYPRKAIPAKRVLVAGLGKAEKLDLEAIRQAAAAAIQKGPISERSERRDDRPRSGERRHGRARGRAGNP